MGEYENEVDAWPGLYSLRTSSHVSCLVLEEQDQNG